MEVELEKFYNWNFMFYEDTSINYSGAENCSPFYPHDMQNIIIDLPLTFSHSYQTYTNSFWREPLTISWPLQNFFF